MENTYVAKILYEIAKEMNRPNSSVEAFIAILQDNWYDTKESLESMTDQEFEKLKIPLKIVQLIRQKLKSSATIPQQIKIEQQKTQIQSEEQGQQKFEQNLNDQLVRIRSQITNDQQYLKSLQTTYKILSNLSDNPLNQQFYSIKLSSKTLQSNIMNFPSVWKLMEQCGWSSDGDSVNFQNTDFQLLRLACVQIKQKIEASTTSSFNPYKAYFSTTDTEQGLTNADVAHKVGYDIYSFSDQLELLKQKRNEIMSQEIKNRDIKIYQGQINQSVHDLMQNFQNEENEIEPSKDPLLKEYLKKIAHSLEEQKFSSKRKKEFEDLFKSPVYHETIIRVRCPSNTIFEAKFAPLEQLVNVVKLFRESLQNPSLNFYIYTTPPVQKMTQKYLVQTLDDLGCVPSGLFYVGFEDQKTEQENPQILKQELLKNQFQLSEQQVIDFKQQV